MEDKRLNLAFGSIALIGFMCMAIIAYAHRHDNEDQLRELAHQVWDRQ